MRCARLAQARGRDGLVRAAADAADGADADEERAKALKAVQILMYGKPSPDRRRERALANERLGLGTTAGTKGKRHAAALARLGAERAAQSFDRPPPPLSERPDARKELPSAAARATLFAALDPLTADRSAARAAAADGRQLGGGTTDAKAGTGTVRLRLGKVGHLHFEAKDASKRPVLGVSVKPAVPAAEYDDVMEDGSSSGWVVF